MKKATSEKKAKAPTKKNGALDKFLSPPKSSDEQARSLRKRPVAETVEEITIDDEDEDDVFVAAVSPAKKAKVKAPSNAAFFTPTKRNGSGPAAASAPSTSTRAAPHSATSSSAGGSAASSNGSSSSSSSKSSAARRSKPAAAVVAARLCEDQCLDGLPLPCAVYVRIAQFLTPLELFTASLVCKSWRENVLKLPSAWHLPVASDASLQSLAAAAGAGVERLALSLAAENRAGELAVVSPAGWRCLAAAAFAATLHELVVRIASDQYELSELVDAAAVEAIVSSLPSLRRLDLFGSGCLTTDAVRTIARLSQLRHLDLGFCFTDRRLPPDIELRALSAVSSLSSLSLRGCQGLRDDSFEGFKLKDLESLDLHDCTHLSFKFLDQFPGLVKLDVSFSAIKRLNPVVGLKKLASLNLSCCLELTDAEFKKLEKVPTLQHLDLQITKVSPAVIDNLQRLKALRTMRLFRTAVEMDSAAAKKVSDEFPVDKAVLFKPPSGNAQRFSWHNEKKAKKTDAKASKADNGVVDDNDDED